MRMKVTYVGRDQWGNEHEVEGLEDWTVEEIKEKMAALLNKGRRKVHQPVQIMDIVDMKTHNRKPRFKGMP